MGGLNFIAVIMGLFAMNEVFKNIGEEMKTISNVRLPPWYRMIKLGEIRKCLGAIFRSSLLGFFVGCVPGATTGIITFMAYDLEKKISKNKKNFGKGAIEGVAAPEGANNSCTSGGFVPLLTLGIPAHAALAVLLSGLMIYGLQPGPLLFEKQPVFVWTIIASMYIGNVMLLVLNLPLVGIWAKMVRVPYKFIGPMILLFCFLGTYSVRNSFFDVGTCFAFGIFGLIMTKLKIPNIPLVIALILSPMMEQALRQTISMGRGSLGILWSRPIALAFIGAGCLAMTASVYLRFRWARVGDYLNSGDED